MISTSRVYSRTNAEEVYAVLKGAGRALSAYQILERLRGSSIRAPTQVYRALEQLQSTGSVHRIHSLNAFVACVLGNHDASRPGILVCQQCGSVFEFEAPALETLPAEIRGTGFMPQSVVLEVAGLCRTCRNAPGPQNEAEHSASKHQ